MIASTYLGPVLCQLALAFVLLTACQAAPDSSAGSVEVLIPEHEAEGEVYLCTKVPLPDQSLRLVGVEPLSKQEVVHHMLLYGK